MISINNNHSSITASTDSLQCFMMPYHLQKTFKLRLHRAIHNWRMIKFDNFLVDISVFTTKRKFESSKHIDDKDARTFKVKSYYNSFFSETLVLEFRERSKFEVFCDDSWMSLYDWLECLIPYAKASHNIDFAQAARSYALYLYNDTKLKCWLDMIPGEIKQQIMTHLIEALDMVDNNKTIKRTTLKALVPGVGPMANRDLRMAFKTDFSRCLTQNLLYRNCVEFTESAGTNWFYEFMTHAPMEHLNDISHIRFILTDNYILSAALYHRTHHPNNQPKQRHQHHSNPIRSLPNWQWPALGHLLSLRSIEIHIPPRFIAYRSALIHAVAPCRTALATQVLAALWPWISLPGRSLRVTGAVNGALDAWCRREMEAVPTTALQGACRRAGRDEKKQKKKKQKRFLGLRAREELAGAQMELEIAVQQLGQARVEARARPVGCRRLDERALEGRKRRANERLVALVGGLVDGIPRRWTCGPLEDLELKKKAQSHRHRPFGNNNLLHLENPPCQCTPRCFEDEV